MPLRSMTGFAQVKQQINDELAFTLSLKSVNHRFLDLQLRTPPDSDALDIKLRRALKEKLARGHVDLTLTLERAGSGSVALNRDLVAGYVAAFHRASEEFAISGQPDLNTVLRLPGALTAATPVPAGEEFEQAVLAALEEAIARLNAMREEEGRSIERELRERMARLEQQVHDAERLRSAVSRAYLEKVQLRMQELIGGHADRDRLLQEAALMADRSDVQEEIVRMQTHVRHMLGLIGEAAEVGKKMDFLLQEMNREANTLLSKTSGVAGEALRITEIGLAMKAEIEKTREQVQNLE